MQLIISIQQITLIADPSHRKLELYSLVVGGYCVSLLVLILKPVGLLNSEL